MTDSSEGRMFSSSGPKDPNDDSFWGALEGMAGLEPGATLPSSESKFSRLLGKLRTGGVFQRWGVGVGLTEVSAVAAAEADMDIEVQEREGVN